MRSTLTAVMLCQYRHKLSRVACGLTRDSQSTPGRLNRRRSHESASSRSTMFWLRFFEPAADVPPEKRLQKALELKLFEDQKDSIKLKTLVSSVVDRETQEKIDIVKSRLIKNFGYDEESATDVLNFVASIFARGDAK